MEFVIGILCIYVLFTIYPVIEYYRNKSRFERLDTEIQHLKSENYTLQRKADEADSLRFRCNDLSYQVNSLKHEFGIIRKTLTPEQRALTRYPSLDPNRVYRTRTGQVFHSVSWCPSIYGNCEQLTIKHAEAMFYSPCAKCVDREQLEFYHKSLGIGPQ